MSYISATPPVPTPAVSMRRIIMLNYQTLLCFQRQVNWVNMHTEKFLNVKCYITKCITVE